MSHKKISFGITFFVLLSGLFFSRCTTIKIPATEIPETENQEPEEIVKVDLEKELEESRKKKCEELLSEMTLEQKVAQMIMPSMNQQGQQNGTLKPITKINGEIKNAVEKNGFGGIILFRANSVSSEQTVTLLHDLQTAATGKDSVSQIPLFLGIDQEGGNIIRVNNACWMPGNMLVGASNDFDLSFRYANLVGREMAALGINVNFAPCADVNYNPANPVIGLRSFSSNPQLASKMVCSAVRGYSQANVISSLKHFPGHGNTAVDSHVGLPKITGTYEELKDLELVPFAAGIDSGVEMIMTAHIQFPDIESETYKSISTGSQVYLPATLSKKIITGVLREKLGFNGIVITDAMDMGALTKHFKKIDAAQLAINAGVDILLMPCDISNATGIRQTESFISQIVDLVLEGKIPESRIDESVFRILMVKQKHQLFDNTKDLESKIAEANTFVSSLENHEEEWKITEGGITVVKNENHLLPLSADENQKIGILCPFSTEIPSVRYALDYIKKTIPCDAKISVNSYSGKSFGSMSYELSSMDTVVIISELAQSSQLTQIADSGSRFAFVKKVIENQHSLGKKVVLISAELPYDIAAYSQADAIVAAYGSFEMKKAPGPDASKNFGYGPNIPVSISAIFGASKANGSLPVDLPALDNHYNFTNKILYKIGTKEDLK